ncbi:hypothetical protein [Halorubrum sp. JWXQ-INN 858]|uniref:hypothetical protein n=1 Tax=Halorubrum sp. JWXQ-INN 858 TaxID=2690782 RepID=UPI00190FB65F|nr:hypothetical protein [Halorubrum sp. JWXQ-INN 858]
MDPVILFAADTLLHAGHEHPSTLWIGVAAVVSFVLGVGIGAFALDLSNPLADRSGDEE